MFRKVQLLRELKEYMTSRRLTEMDVGELTSFYARCRVAPEEFSTQYIGLFPEVGLVLQLVDGTAQKIVIAGGAALGHPVSPPVPPVTEVHEVTAEHAHAATAASSPVETLALAGSLSEAVSANAAVAQSRCQKTRIARQRQLVRQLKKYMKSYKLTELRVGALASFYDAYKVPVGDFSVEYVGMFPDVGLTLRDVPGAGRVIERHDDATPPSHDAAQIAEQARQARQLLLVRRLKTFMKLRQVTELPVEALGAFCQWCKLPPGEFSPQFVRSFPEVGLTLETDRGASRVVVQMQAKRETKAAKSIAATAHDHQRSSSAASPWVLPPVLTANALQSATAATASSSPRDDVSLASASSSSSSSSSSSGSPRDSVDAAPDDAVSTQGIDPFQHGNSPLDTVDAPVAKDAAGEAKTASSEDTGRALVMTSDTLPSALAARTVYEEDTATVVVAAAGATAVPDDASEAASVVDSILAASPAGAVIVLQESDSGATARSLTTAEAVSRTAGPVDVDAEVATAAVVAAGARAVSDPSRSSLPTHCVPQTSAVESRAMLLGALRAKVVPTATSVAESGAHAAYASPVTLPPHPATSTAVQPFNDVSLAPSSSLETDRSGDESEDDVGTVYGHASPCLARYPVGTRLYLSFDAAGHPLVSHDPLAPPAASTPLPPCNTRDEIERLLQMLPPLANRVERTTLQQMIHLPHATELVYDLGRPPLMRFHCASFGTDDAAAAANGRGRGVGAVSWTTPISSAVVTHGDIDHVLRALGGDDRFSSDHRCGLDHTLHRISRRVNRQRTTIGFTMRIGRMVPGSTTLISDLIAARRSILLIGCPGVGKTTLLRDLARVLSASNSSAVEIIDTSNEIAGEGDVPHASIGAARRMMVGDRRRQHEVMVEAVQNHMPTCLVIDEIGTKQEARAAMDVRHRGIQLIGTAHGTGLQQLVENPELNGLFGGIHTVILSDGEAARRGLRSKSVQERMGPCAFDCAIELAAVGTWVIHHHLADAVDRLLLKHSQQRPLTYEVRRMRQRTAAEATNDGPWPRLEMTVEVVSAVEPFHPPPLATM